MAGGHVKYRTLNRNSADRQHLLRNLVTSLFQNESISTTWAKAKETQRLAEKLVTLAKKNSSASRRRAHEILYSPLSTVPNLFTTIRERYAERPGGYTRVLRVEPLKVDQGDSAILELVDGPKDMRFTLTAQTVARDRMLGRPSSRLTEQNKDKVLQFRTHGAEQFEEMVQKFIAFEEEGRETAEPQKKELYKHRTEATRGLSPKQLDGQYIRTSRQRRHETFKRQFLNG